jgi:hypothetical protein
VLLPALVNTFPHSIARLLGVFPSEASWSCLRSGAAGSWSLRFLDPFVNPTHISRFQSSEGVSSASVSPSFCSVCSITVGSLSCAHTGRHSYEFVVLYVIILSAALDLVPPSTPKGIIAFWNITPGIVAKFSWPYLLKGRIHYARRLIGCCFLSVTGMIVSHLSGYIPKLTPSDCRYFRGALPTLVWNWLRIIRIR